jgi:hypothetical protein
MTPARLAEIRAYIQRLDQRRFVLTVEQRIIGDLWSALPEAWREGFKAGRNYPTDDQDSELLRLPLNPYPESRPNPYRDGEQQ